MRTTRLHSRTRHQCTVDGSVMNTTEILPPTLIQIRTAQCPAQFVPMPPNQVELAEEVPGAAAAADYCFRQLCACLLPVRAVGRISAGRSLHYVH
jgi:hypothetical protein